MKRRCFFMLISAFAIVFGMVSCGQQTQDYQSVIPADPVVVVKANVHALLTKSELLQDNQVAGFAKTAINEMPENTRGIMREILNDPSNSGLALDKPAFIVVDNIENMRGFALFAVSDNEKVKALVDAVDEETLSVSDEGAYTLVKLGNDNLAAFDDSKLVVAFAQGAFDVKEYMLAEEGAEKSDELEDFLVSQEDVAYYVSYKDILRLAEGAVADAFAGMDMEKFKDLKLVCNVNFYPGQAVMDIGFCGNDEIEKIYREHVCDANTDLHSFIPAATMALMQAGTKNMGTYIEETVGNNPNAAILLDEINKSLKKMGVKQEFAWSLLNSLDGSCVFAVSEIDNTAMLPMPQMTLLAECKDDKLFAVMVELLQSMGSMVSKTADNVYKVAGMYYIGYVDNKIFVMPTSVFKEAYADNSLKALPVNVASTPVATSLDGQVGLAVDFQSVAATLEATGLIRSRSDKALLRLLRKFKGTNYIVNDEAEVKWTVTFQDDKTNALKQLKDLVITTAIDEAIN